MGNSRWFKRGVVFVSALMVGGIVATSTGSVKVSADEVQSAVDVSDESATVEVIDSDSKYDDLINELDNMNNGSLSDFEKKLQISDLLNKYDGAEATLEVSESTNVHSISKRSITASKRIHEKIIAGGVNDFTYSKKG